MSSMYGNQGMRGSTGLASQGRRGSTGNVPAGYQQGQLSNFTPEMMELFQRLFGNVSPDSYTGRLAQGDESLFNEIEAPALRQFSGLQGNIASRFSAGGGGQGALSSRRSSGFQNTSNQAASNFAQELQARRQELQRNAIRDMHGMSIDLLGQRPYENYLLPKEPSFFEKLIGGLFPGAGAAIGGIFGGTKGAKIGAQAGGAASQAFF